MQPVLSDDEKWRKGSHKTEFSVVQTPPGYEQGLTHYNSTTE